MADLMPYNTQSLIVCHRFQKSRIDPHASVSAGESIDFVRLVDLEIQRNPIDGCDPGSHPPDSFDIRAGLRKHGVLRIEFLDVLADISLYLRVGQRGRLGHLGATGKQIGRIELFRT